MNPSPALTLADVVAARTRIAGAIVATPCAISVPLSELTGCRIWCKREYLQRTGSFKERGARHALATLTPREQSRGVIAASAGNHALGLAWHGRQMGIPVTVVMPLFAPLVKLAQCRRFGATVVLHGETFDEARQEAIVLARKRKLRMIPPFDDLSVIAGQGTVALEILEQVPEFDAVIVPVGGGGLLAGVATVLRAHRPEVKIYGVEPAHAASFAAGLAARQPARIETQFTLADGLAVAEAGRLTLALAGPLIDGMVTASEASLALAILRLAELEKAIVEGAGAAPLAALLEHRLPKLRKKDVVLILSGGNIDPLAHTRVVEKGLVADGRMYRFDVLIGDRPGALARFSAILAKAGANVTEIVHNRTFAGPDLSRVHVLCTVETRDWDHIREIDRLLAAEGVAFTPTN